jgi:hypothetical protein
MTDSKNTPRDEQTVERYEPPQLETVLTPDEIEREVHYAGKPTGDTETV